MKVTQTELKEWKENRLTKIFFEHLEKKMNELAESIVNKSIAYEEVDTRHIGGRLSVYRLILQIDENDLSTEEKDEK